MPKAKTYANAFSGPEIAHLSGLSKPMVNYLASAGFLLPTHRPGPEKRGSVRYFGFRDLLVARIVSRLSVGGVELKRLKEALLELQRSSFWDRLGPDKACAMMITDGSSILVQEEDGSLVDLTRRGQLAFAFVVDLAEADADLRSRVDPVRLEHFHYGAQEPILALADGAITP